MLKRILALTGIAGLLAVSLSGTASATSSWHPSQINSNNFNSNNRDSNTSSQVGIGVVNGQENNSNNSSSGVYFGFGP